MRLRIISQNLQYGGIRDSAGGRDDRWDAVVEVIRGSGAHIALLQEAEPWTDHNHQQAARAEKDLGMRFPWGAVQAGHSTAIMYDPDTVRLAQWESRHRASAAHGFVGVAVFEVPGLETPLAVGSAHLDPGSIEAAAERVKRLAWRVRRYGDVGILGGDLNHFPLEHCLDPPLPDPARLPAANLIGRWTGPPEAMRPDRSIGEALARGRFTDTAQHFAEQRKDAALLAPTGKSIRVDQIHVTEALVPALKDYRAIAHGHSDHAVLVLEVDTALIDPSRVLAPNT